MSFVAAPRAELSRQAWRATSTSCGEIPILQSGKQPPKPAQMAEGFQFNFYSSGQMGRFDHIIHWERREKMQTKPFCCLLGAAYRCPCAVMARCPDLARDVSVRTAGRSTRRLQPRWWFGLAAGRWPQRRCPPPAQTSPWAAHTI